MINIVHIITRVSNKYLRLTVFRIFVFHKNIREYFHFPNIHNTIRLRYFWKPQSNLIMLNNIEIAFSNNQILGRIKQIKS